MPIFEEKLICPLAVRFSQDHIRPEFQKGPDMEAAIKAIKTKPGCGEYDIVLTPPFPAIEVIRGHLKSGDADHWLSLDNRRLYCLQRAAVAHWPLRVAVAVEALRAPTEGMRKKVNSSVDGLSVGIGHSPKALIGRWDWHKEVESLSDDAPEGMAGDSAHRTIASDDAKMYINDLADAEKPPSMLDLFFQEEKANDHSDASTVEPRSPRGSEGSSESSMLNIFSGTGPRTQEAEGDWMPNIVGAWKDAKDNFYNISVATDESWTCWRKASNGSNRKFTLWYDEASDSLSWGDDWSCWADASDVRNDINCISWYAGRDAAKWKPRFQLCRVERLNTPSKQSRRSKCSKKRSEKVER
jgi:hypothetical protein